jgi:Polysaccharide lyase
MIFAIRYLIRTLLAVFGAFRRSRKPLSNRECDNRILFCDNFDAGRLCHFSPCDNVDGVGLVNTPRRDGRCSAQVSLNPAKNKNHYRSEICPRSVRGFLEGRFPRFRREYWYSLSLNIPIGFVTDDYPITFAQWHGIPDHLFKEAYRHPPLSFSISGDNYVIHSRADSKLITPPSGPDRYEFSHEFTFGSVSQDLGHWVDWVVHVRWSYRDDGLGFLNIWKDGVVVYARRGPNCYNDWRGGPYLKTGIYIWALQFMPKEQLQSVRPRHLFLGAVRVGGLAASYGDVAPWTRDVDLEAGLTANPISEGGNSNGRVDIARPQLSECRD